MEEVHLIKLDTVRGTLADKDSRAREMGADIDRLTHEVQLLRSDGKMRCVGE